MKRETALLLLIVLGVAFWLLVQRTRHSVPRFRVPGLPFGYNALTVPPLGVFVRADQWHNRALMEHETVHWHQYQREGLVGFAAGYAKAHRQHGYDANPYEREARRNEMPHCQANYTDCVRRGQARTVHNPIFRQ